MIFKLIILAAVIYGVYILFFRNGNLVEKMAQTKPKSKKNETVETVVECKKCGIYISTDEAVIKDGKYYCSNECAGIK